MKDINLSQTAVVITDPQNDFLHTEGAAWPMVQASVEENETIDHLEMLFQTAKSQGIPVFISPHYYYPTDHQWKFEGRLEETMHEIQMFDREGPLSLEGFQGSGADWLERLKPYIEDGSTVIVSPHKVYGPQSNDLVLQLRKRGINTVLLAGMSANLCVESHMRDLLEQGFEIIIVKDATAAAQSPELGDGYAAALTNFGFMANDVVTTEEVIQAIRGKGGQRPMEEARPSP
ncbi:MAG: cysteine hydrolase [Bradymonadaceae bacterium]